MDITYQNEGDIVYKAEQFRFRFQGHQTAVIELLSMINEQDNNSYAYHISIEDESVPKQYREINSADTFLFKHINPELESRTTYPSKDACLQNAVNWLSYIMENHSDKEVLDWGNDTE